MSEGKKLSPEFRFPEFTEDWKFEELENCLDYLQPTPYLVKNTDYNDDYKTPVLTAGKSFILGYTDEKKGIFDENLPVIIFDDFTTASKFVDFPFKTKSSAMKILLGKNEHVVKFVYESMQTLKFEAGVHKRHWISVFSKLQIPVPENTEEQQKIADCLSSLDELISSQNEKLEALKDHKKGLLQILFPQEGETVPKVRFLEFEKDGEWVSKPIEKVFSIFQGYAFSSKESVSNGIRWLKIADVGIQKMNHESPSFLPKTHKEEYERYLLKKGDYVLALTRPILDMQLKIARVDDTFHGSLLNQRVGKLVTSNNPGFVFYLLQTTELVESIDRNIAGSEPPNLSFKQISDIKVFIPTEKGEQRKIASFLSNIDSLISKQIKKIEGLQKQKKGLMQGLFPKVED